MDRTVRWFPIAIAPVMQDHTIDFYLLKVFRQIQRIQKTNCGKRDRTVFFNNRKVTAFIICLIILIVCGAVYYQSYKSRMTEEAYNNAVDMISQGRYPEGEELLQGIPEGYNDRDVLLAYTGSKQLDNVNEQYGLMTNIPDKYSGDLHEEILSYKLQVYRDYNKLLAETKRKAALKEAEEEARKKKLYADTYPSYGMREEVLKYCALGTPTVKLCPSFYSLVPRARYKEYIFGEAGKALSGKITIRFRWHNSSRYDDYEDLPADNGYAASGFYYDSDGVRYDFDFEGMRVKTNSSRTDSSRKKKSTAESSETDKSDPYNVYDYDDPEEFYFDWPEDFDGYEDAEQYWDDAQ